MSSGSRIELKIDVFDARQQRALVLPELTRPELISAILQEFGRDYEFLADEPDVYMLVRKADNSPITGDGQIGELLRSGDELMLLENNVTVPVSAEAPSHGIYLREVVSGRVFKLGWVPAIIGRPDQNQPNNSWLAVNLESFVTGLRVSRRQAVISESDGGYYINSLSNNPTYIRDEAGSLTPVGPDKLSLRHGDTIFLERSNIGLKFIVR